MMAQVSVVIPTFNRKESLVRTLQALKPQTIHLLEIIVVDASQVPAEAEELQVFSGIKELRVITSTPSVCQQRNRGIKEAKGEFVFLLDDDIEVDERYVKTLKDFLAGNNSAMVTSGLVLEKDKNENWQYMAIQGTFFGLVLTRVFYLGLWGDPEKIPTKVMCSVFKKKITRYYKQRGNTISRAGWPMNSDFSTPVFRARIYGLGASMHRRVWLLEHLYDEHLDAYGIGDNYGIALQLKEEQGIFVLHAARAYHAKTKVNRQEEHRSYKKRVLALDYFSSLHGTASRVCLVWSLFGNILKALAGARWKMAGTNISLIVIILIRANPLIRAAKAKQLRA